MDAIICRQSNKKGGERNTTQTTAPNS